MIRTEQPPSNILGSRRLFTDLYNGRVIVYGCHRGFGCLAYFYFLDIRAPEDYVLVHILTSRHGHLSWPVFRAKRAH